MDLSIKTMALSGITFILMLFVSATADVRASTVTIDATSNIFGAGHAVPPDPGGGGGGTLPPSVSFTSGSNSSSHVSIRSWNRVLRRWFLGRARWRDWERYEHSRRTVASQESSLTAPFFFSLVYS